MKSLKIGLDFDGVISDCQKLKSETAKRLFGVAIHPDQFKKEFVLGNGLLTHEQLRAVQKEVNLVEEVGLRMTAVPEVRRFLPKLLGDGHEISIVSSRDGKAADIAKKWLHTQKLPHVPFVEVGWKQDKTPYIQGFDIFIDDDLEKLVPAVGVVPHLYLFSWGYNARENESGIATRIHSWKEFYREVARISNKTR